MVAAIPVTTRALFAYLGYIALGLAAGTAAVFVLTDQLRTPSAFLLTNLVLYSFVLLAHYRFTHGFIAWPRFERGNLGRTLTWAVVFTLAGWVAIGYIQGAWSGIVAGAADDSHLRPSTHIHGASAYMGRTGAIVIAFVDSCIFAPIAEEIVFRTGMYRMLKSRFSITTAAAVSAAIFSATHLSMTAFLPIFALGCLCCWIYEKTSDVRGPILLHAGFNFLVFFTAIRTQG